jgi:hypothetical protein
MGQEMKYYIYISPIKVDMLYAQIPQGLKSKIATKLTIDLKLIKTEFSEKQSQENLFSKLKIVTDYLDQGEELGTVDNPKAYFRGELPMRWGPYGMGYGKEEPIVYFGGITNKTIVGLGGSNQHVIGNPGSSLAFSDSLAPMLISVLTKELGLASKEGKYEFENQDFLALEAVAGGTHSMRGPKQKIQFIAKKLIFSQDLETDFRSNWEGRGVLLGSPIYAALAD